MEILCLLVSSFVQKMNASLYSELSILTDNVNVK